MHACPEFEQSGCADGHCDDPVRGDNAGGVFEDCAHELGPLIQGVVVSVSESSGAGAVWRVDVDH